MAQIPCPVRVRRRDTKGIRLWRGSPCGSPRGSFEKGGMTQRGEAQVISASVPLSEMFGYSTKLRSMSQGRAVYSMEFALYEEVPKSKAEEIISKVKA